MGFFSRKPKDTRAGEAEVLFAALTPKASRQTGKRNLEHEVKLLVDRPEGGAREVSFEVTVPWDRPLVQGTRIPVLISPSDPDFVEIDFEGVRSLTDLGERAVEAAREGRALTPDDLDM